jgi:hypothetical protein
MARQSGSQRLKTRQADGLRAPIEIDCRKTNLDDAEAIEL